MPKTRANTISIHKLAGAVGTAVQKMEKHREKVQPEFRIDFSLIMGRWLREEMALPEAQTIAQQITDAVQGGHLQEALGASAPHLQPAVLAHGGHIICGFIPDPSISFTAE
ncbi:hypothetical protein [Limobrevibacterium gyesilva]|uniref:Uncharacterized protein n=1 Tax=Limobrevibacterium gyesilva TaxID=2991712 RepID=A0AA42CGS5_9PROT|nr:hypothetical protein [Limobrevibacterium gyesilva]MCW3476401.1 hypothetical protein [Limobrevibacterium gyesilva]